MTKNQDVANLLYEISKILEIQGVAFKPRAYQRAALNIESLGDDIEKVAREGRLGELPGVGKAISEKVTEFLETGKLEYLEKLRKELPKGLLEMMQIPGVGPKSAQRLYDELQIKSLASLEKAAKAGRIRKLKGFGEKSEKEILEGLARAKQQPGRFPWPTAFEVAKDLMGALRATGVCERADFAGSLRRGRHTVGDVDLLAVASEKDAPRLVDAFVRHRDPEKVLERGSTRARIVLRNGLNVDLRVVGKESYGAALQYFTGSKEHNIALRTRALKRGWTINEYALSRKKDGKVIAGEKEEEIYEKLGLAWIPPELREDNGEIELASERKVPRLLEVSDIRGDLHTHTKESDGYASAETMAEAAAKLGYEWYGVSDHSKGLGIARGLDGARYLTQRRLLRRLQDRFPKMVLLQGAEVNIRKTGELDLEGAVLAELDFVIGSVHSSFTLPPEEQTKRVIAAMDAGIDVLAHPSARQLGARPEIDVDWDRLFDAAAERGVMMEINASPFRLDLWGERIRAARKHGVDFVTNTDAHTAGALATQHFGVTQARRGGLEKGSVVSTGSISALRKRLGRAKRK